MNSKNNADILKAQKRAVKKYLKAVKKELTCSPLRKRAFLKELEGSILEYVSQGREKSPEDIAETFGSAEAIAESFIERAKPKTLKWALKFGGKLLVLLLVIALALSLTFISINTFNYIKAEDFRNNSYDIETISYNVPPSFEDLSKISGVN